MDAVVALLEGEPGIDEGRLAAIGGAMRALLPGGPVQLEAATLVPVAQPPFRFGAQEDVGTWAPTGARAVLVATSAPVGLDRAQLAAAVRAALPDAAYLWAAERHRMLDLVGATEPGAVGRVALLRRATTLSRAEFGAYWLRRHAPLAMRHGPLFRRYETLVSADDADGRADGRAAGPVWDGMVVQWFADRQEWDEHDRLIATEKTAVREDLPRYVDIAYQFEARDPLHHLC